MFLPGAIEYSISPANRQAPCYTEKEMSLTLCQPLPVVLPVPLPPLSNLFGSFWLLLSRSCVDSVLPKPLTRMCDARRAISISPFPHYKTPRRSYFPDYLGSCTLDVEERLPKFYTVSTPTTARTSPINLCDRVQGEEGARICKAIPSIYKSREASMGFQGSCQTPIRCVRPIDIIFKPRI